MVALGGESAGASVTNGPSIIALLTARQYVDAATTVRIQGTVTQVTNEYRVDVTLFANGDSSGIVTVDGHLARIVIVGTWYYLEGTAGFWTSVFNQSPSNSERLSKEWIGVPRSSLTGLGANLSMEHLRSGFDLSPNVVLASAGISTVDGHRALGVRISGKGTLWIAASGYRPVAFDGTNSGNELSIRFSDWGRGAPPRVPPGAVQFFDSGASSARATAVSARSAQARPYELRSPLIPARADAPPA